MASERIYFYIISSGSCFTQSRVPTASFPRICDQGDVYLYRIAGSLLVSRDAGFTWTNILPTGMGSVSAMALTIDDTSTDISIGTGSVTYTISTGIARYHKVPETGTWTSGSTPPTNFVPEIAASDLAGEIGILVGNIHSGVESRIVSTPSIAPYALSDSDAGIPQTSGSMGLITCLEICD